MKMKTKNMYRLYQYGRYNDVKPIKQKIMKIKLKRDNGKSFLSEIDVEKKVLNITLNSSYEPKSKQWNLTEPCLLDNWTLAYYHDENHIIEFLFNFDELGSRTLEPDYFLVWEDDLVVDEGRFTVEIL